MVARDLPDEGSAGRRGMLMRLAAALGIGAVGGVLFTWLALPLPWMLGALAANLVASLGGARVGVPERLRVPMMAVLGVMIGSSFQPERLSFAAADWLPSLVALPFYIIVVGAVVFLYFRRLSGYDASTVFFAAAPGGLSEMILLADQMGGDMRRVSLVHATRLLFIVFTIPFIAQLFGADTSGVRASMQSATTIAPADLTLLAALGGLGYLLATRLRLPAGGFVGPLIASAVAHLAGWIETEPPFALMAAAQLVVGSAVGARFAGVPLAFIGRAMLLGAGATMLMLVITLAFGGVLAGLSGQSLTLLLLAFIPGGFPEMSLIALAMGVDPAFVVTHHALRVSLVVLIALPIYTLLARKGRFGLTRPAPPDAGDRTGT